MVSEVTLGRRAFWAFFAEAAPALCARTGRGNETSRWLPIGGLVIAHYVGAGAVGIFVRGPYRSRIGHAREVLFPHREAIARALGPKVRLGTGFLIETRLRLDMGDRANWPRAVEWLEGQSQRYEALLDGIGREVSSARRD